MISLKNNPYHSHMCGNLSSKFVGAKVKVAGWINNIRKLGGLTFLTLRDQTGVVQIFTQNDKLVQGLTRESVVSVLGEVRPRGEKNVNFEMQTGEIEIFAKEIALLNPCTETLPFEIINAREQAENTRLKYRYLDLRNPKNYKNILLRAKVLKFLRQQMEELEFVEIQTPIMTSSSPEGARDFLIPSRQNPGCFYALPQSPQQFKQLLMVSGFNRYYQIAPCFRDEDARADRSPTDFYQLDFEIGFSNQDEILSVLERVLFAVLSEFSSNIIERPPFEKIKFSESLKLYGTDKPDLRNPLRLIDLTKEFSCHNFTVFNKKHIFALKCSANQMGRRFFDKLNDFIKFQGGEGLVYLKYENDEFSGSAVKYFDKDDIKKLKLKTEINNNETLFIITDTKEIKALKLAGLLRDELGEKLDLIDKRIFKPCFIIDFPFYEETKEGKIEFSHNPFSMPQGGMKSLKNKNFKDILAFQYDLVLNGVELASGAVRNHNCDIMIEAFKIAGYEKETVKNMFPALFNAFKFGAPPHAGAAIGFDRLLMFLANEESIKEVIAFPMNKSAQDPLTGAPSRVSEGQLKEVFIKLDLKTDK